MGDKTMSNREILFKGFAPDEDGKQIITLNGVNYIKKSRRNQDEIL